MANQHLPLAAQVDIRDPKIFLESVETEMLPIILFLVNGVCPKTFVFKELF